VNNKEQIKKRFNDVAKSKTFRNILSSYELSKKSVLDIGCSYGEHLVHFGNGSVGLTITESEIEYGKKEGIDIRYGNIEASDFQINEKFDAIFANNILEHLFSPHYFLYRARKLLNDNGVLILGVPCVPKVVSLMCLKKWRGSLSLPHINFWTGETLQRSVERGGFNVHETRGFHFKNKFLDALFHPIYPHFYCIATPISDFKYPEERMGELIDRLDLVFKEK